MDSDRASRTAEHVALFRALESARHRGRLFDRGLTLVADLSTHDAATRYLAPLGRDEPTATFYRIASAEVR